MADRLFPNYSLAERFKNSSIQLTRREQLALRKKDPVKHLPESEKAAFIKKVQELDNFGNKSMEHETAQKRINDYRTYLLLKHFPRNEDEFSMSQVFYKAATQEPLFPLPLICTVSEERIYDTEKVEDLKRFWRDCVNWHKENNHNMVTTKLVEKALDLEG